jgi:predicted transcriptional regulator
MNKAIQHLIHIGLNEKEARIYLALAKIGKGTAYAIAKHAGLKRPTVYVVLDELRKKGLIKKIPHAKNQVFIAKDLNEFFSDIEEKLYQAKQVLPRLVSANTHVGITAHMFEGKDELEKALEYKRPNLRNEEVIAFYGAPQKSKKVPDAYYRHAELMKLQNTKIRGFAPKHSSLEKFRNLEKSFNQEIISLPENIYSPKVSVEVCKDISKIFLHTSTQALVIENKEYADFMRQVFNLIWSSQDTNNEKIHD